MLFLYTETKFLSINHDLWRITDWNKYTILINTTLSKEKNNQFTRSLKQTNQEQVLAGKTSKLLNRNIYYIN